MATNTPNIPPGGATPTTPPAGYQQTPKTGPQFVFLAIVAAIIVALVLFPATALGVLFPPCLYQYPNRPAGPLVTATPTLDPAQITSTASAAAAATGTASAVTANQTPTSTVVITGTPVPTPNITATAQAQQQLDEGRKALAEDAASFAIYAHCLGEFNGFIDYSVKFLAIIAALVTTIASTQGWRFIGFTSGGLVTAMTAFQTAFPMETRATFYQGLAVQVDSIVAEVRYLNPDEARLRQLRTDFDNIKANAAKGPIVSVVTTAGPTGTPTAPTATTTTTATTQPTNAPPLAPPNPVAPSATTPSAPPGGTPTPTTPPGG